MRRACVAALLCACGGPVQHDTGLEGLTLASVAPTTAIVGSTLVLTGSSFVDASLGSTRVHFAGTSGGQNVDFIVPSIFKSSAELDVKVDAALFMQFGNSDTTFTGNVSVEVDSAIDRKTHTTALMTTLTLATALTPTVSALGDGLSFVNQPIDVVGDSFLLGGDEGKIEAYFEGCFQAESASDCTPIAPVAVPAQPVMPLDRTKMRFPYATSISGIGSGSFDGTITMRNVFADGRMLAAAAKMVHFDIQRPSILSASTTAASLGQYVVLNGGGFVGTPVGTTASDPTEVTLLAITGSFQPDGSGASRSIDEQLVTQFFSGPQIRYVVDEADHLGMIINYRTESGTITGTIKPIVKKGSDSVEGAAVPVSLRVLPVKQLVFVNFLSGYTDSLRKFGIRALETRIADRILTVMKRDYAGVNIEFRTTPPDDFALFATLDIGGPDPNELGLAGYDNTHGKDSGNKRLEDHVGGFSALTQADGDPGYGGVFAETFMGFSKHPNGLAKGLPIADAGFDKIFDPFRPDIGGTDLTATELAMLNADTLTDGKNCPANANRKAQTECALFVFGNLIGSTSSHELAHSLGLAHPEGGDPHDIGDVPNRLMESGGGRSFNERAELLGEGPSVFCDTGYAYLRKILPAPSDNPETTFMRPACN